MRSIPVAVSGERAARVVVVAVAALQAGVFAAVRFLPLVDLPQHVAAARLLANVRRPDLAALYDVQLLPQVNVLALLIAAPLHALLPEAVAVRGILALYFGTLAWALLRLARAAGAPAWSAALALLFAVQFNLWYGFLSYCLGLPILLLLLARFASGLPDPAIRPSWRTLAGDVVLWWLLALAHTLLLSFAIAAFGLWCVWRRAPRRQVGPRALAIVPALVWVGVWWLEMNAVLSRVFPHHGVAPGIAFFWESPGTKLASFGQALIVAGRNGMLEWSVLLCAGGFLLWRFVAEWRGRANDGPDRRSVTWLRLVGLLALVAFAALPYSIYERDRVTYGLFILYQRFLVLAPLVVLPTLTWPRAPRSRRIAIVVLCAAHLVLAARWSVLLASAGREAAGLDDAIARIPPQRIVKSLIYTPFPRGLRYEAFLHAASYYQARKLGETDQSFALLVPNPVHYRNPLRPYLSRQDEHLRPQQFDWRRARMYDAVLIYDRDGEWQQSYQAAIDSNWPLGGSNPPPGPHPLAVPVYERNGWIVLRIVRGNP